MFKKALTDPVVLDECDIEDAVREKLVEDIKKRLTPQAVKIRSDVEVSCFTYEGIDAVKAALKAGLGVSTDDLPIKIHLIAPPQYVVTTNTLDRNEGLAAVGASLQRIKDTVEGSGGSFKILVEPKVVTDMDEKEIRSRLDLLDLEGEEEEENDVGMTAPVELDKAVDAEEYSGNKQSKEESSD